VILDFARSPRDNRCVTERERPSNPVRRLVVPLVLAITIVGTVAAVTTTSSGCGDNAGPSDAGVDTPPDTPII